jgi:signal transduction histidine kinase
MLGARPYVEEALRWVPDPNDQPATISERPELNAKPSVFAATVPVSDASRARVLIADDNADMRAYLRQLLAKHWEVETCPDGGSALAVAAANPPALILTDVMMPGLDGLMLVRALREDKRTAHLPIVVLSARASSEATIKGLEAGADDYVLKPFSAPELIARVRANLELARLRNELAETKAEASLAGARRDFMNMAAHELRSPLAVVTGYLSMLQDGTITPDSREFPATLATIGTKAKEATTLVERVLVAARLEADRLTLERIQVDLRELAEQAVNRAKPLANLAGERLTLQVPSSPVPVNVDPRYVGMILDNLVSNALLHGAGGVLVSIPAEDEPSILVRDSGRGVSADLRERIFEPFIRAEEHIRGSGGTGLGLSISRGLAEAHGGTLTLEQAAGPGAVFVLRLPAKQPA